MYKTTAEKLVEHKFNPKCFCSKCFFKEIMDKSGASYNDILQVLFEFQKDGLIEINDYDSTGFPTEIQRKVSKKQFKAVVGMPK